MLFPSQVHHSVGCKERKATCRRMCGMKACGTAHHILYMRDSSFIPPSSTATHL